MTAVSKILYTDTLDEIVDKYNKTYNGTVNYCRK